MAFCSGFWLIGLVSISEIGRWFNLPDATDMKIGTYNLYYGE